MPVYMVVETKTLDADLYAQYQRQASDIVTRYGGHYVVRSGEVTPLSGGWEPERIIVVEFPSLEKLKRCFSSPEYREIAHLREAGAESRSVIVEACDG